MDYQIDHKRRLLPLWIGRQTYKDIKLLFRNIAFGYISLHYAYQNPSAFDWTPKTLIDSHPIEDASGMEQQRSGEAAAHWLEFRSGTVCVRMFRSRKTPPLCVQWKVLPCRKSRLPCTHVQRCIGHRAVVAVVVVVVVAVVVHRRSEAATPHHRIQHPFYRFHYLGEGAEGDVVIVLIGRSGRQEIM